MEIDQLAASLAHELCNAECFAFTGEGPKPHSARCEATAVQLRFAMRKFGDPMQAEIERLRAALKPFAELDFRDNGQNGYVNPPVYTADIRRARELVGHQQIGKD